MMTSRENRLYLESDITFEDGLTAVIDNNENCSYTDDKTKGRICVSVSAEHAVDSYNCSFESEIHLTKEQAIQLRDWLSAGIKII